MKSLLPLFALLFIASHLSAESYQDQLIERSRARHLARDPEWLRLLHVSRDLLGRQQSEVDDARFFFSPRGRRHPDAELEMDLARFFDPPAVDSDTQHPQCQFPARYAWLKDRLQFDPETLPEQPCPRFSAWSERMDAGSVSVIFASYYMNNPASMYGHTFLRLGARSRQDPTHLLDYAVNYGADTRETNGVLFAVYGLTGGYRGRFSTIPYYMKVQEYNNLESRDLWEYHVNLSSAQITRLVQHLWEMGSGSIAYYFFNRNCSYELLPLLEVANPRLSLSKPFLAKAIPTDTLRALCATPGLVTRRIRRPSHVSKLLKERQELTRAEAVWADRLARAPHPAQLNGAFTQEVNSPRRACVLDTAYDDFRYRTGFQRPRPEALLQRERELLDLRNAETAPVPASDIAPDPVDPPESGHPSGRVAAGYGISSRSHFEEVDLRSALHDLDDPQAGYTTGSRLEMFHLRLRYDNERHTVYPQEITLVDLASLSPWDAWVYHPSWMVGTGLQVAEELPKDPENSLYYGAHGGSGVTFRTPLPGSSIIYALGILDGGIGRTFQDGYRIGGGGVSGLTFNFGNAFRTRIEGSYFTYAAGQTNGVVTWRVIESVSLRKNLDLHATLERRNQYKEAFFSALCYL